MEFQFVIPSSNNDLLEADGNNYFVKRVFDPNEIPDLLIGNLIVLLLKIKETVIIN